MRFPKVRVHQACPVSPGTPVHGLNFVGTAFGAGPVRVSIDQAGDLARGLVEAGPTDVARWLGIKTLWYVAPTYRGWVVIRAQRLDGPGAIAALGEAQIGPVLIAPGQTPIHLNGWREDPVGTYIRTPGCYGWQVDGSSFHEEIVLKAVPLAAFRHRRR